METVNQAKDLKTEPIVDSKTKVQTLNAKKNKQEGEPEGTLAAKSAGAKKKKGAR